MFISLLGVRMEGIPTADCFHLISFLDIYSFLNFGSHDSCFLSNIPLN